MLCSHAATTGAGFAKPSAGAEACFARLAAAQGACLGGAAWGSQHRFAMRRQRTSGCGRGQASAISSCWGVSYRVCVCGLEHASRYRGVTMITHPLKRPLHRSQWSLLHVQKLHKAQGKGVPIGSPADLLRIGSIAPHALVCHSRLGLLPWALQGNPPETCTAACVARMCAALCLGIALRPST